MKWGRRQEVASTDAMSAATPTLHVVAVTSHICCKNTKYIDGLLQAMVSRGANVCDHGIES